MSLSWISWKPRIDEPSKPTPSAKLSAYARCDRDLWRVHGGLGRRDLQIEVGVRASGVLTDADYKQTLIPLLEKTIAE